MCVYVWVCAPGKTYFRNSPKALAKGSQALSLLLFKKFFHKYFGLWASHSICLVLRLTITPGQVTQACACSRTVWPPRPLALPGSSLSLASVLELTESQVQAENPPASFLLPGSHSDLISQIFFSCMLRHIFWRETYGHNAFLITCSVTFTYRSMYTLSHTPKLAWMMSHRLQICVKTELWMQIIEIHQDVIGR